MISERFTSLNPLSVRKMRAREIFLLMGRLTEYSARKQGLGKGEYYKTINGERVKFRPAQDNWF